ncbi:MAG: hypothetical protein K2Y14_08785 [Burkholderiales bacterium]|nr:hypothetical protein [Burkholderiales bacterium]
MKINLTRLTKQAKFCGMLSAITAVAISHASALTSAETTKYITVNYFDVHKPAKVQLEYKLENAQKVQQTTMQAMGNGWYQQKVKATTLQFGFVDSNNHEVNLGGTLGDYPSTNHEFFTATAANVWVKDMIVYPFDPESETQRDRYLNILTLNLHTYQESNQSEKFKTIAEAISKLKPDIISMPECAQAKSSESVGMHYGSLIRQDNAALIITNLLQKDYHLNYNYFWSWSHLGFDKYEEGNCILTRGKIVQTAQQYVTHNASKTFWKSRNALMTEIELNNFGRINMYSAHLGWWDDTEEPFKDMFDNLLTWEQTTTQQIKPNAAFIAGDLNLAAGSHGYNYMLSNDKFIDTYLNVNPNGMQDPTIGGKIDGWKDGDVNGLRIDYILMDKASPLKAVLAERIFTELSYGRVSDHNGTYAFFEKSVK